MSCSSVALSGRPDVVLVDWRLGEAESTRMVADLMGADDPTPVIVLSTARERARAREMRSGGVRHAR